MISLKAYLEEKSNASSFLANCCKDLSNLFILVALLFDAAEGTFDLFGDTLFAFDAANDLFCASNISSSSLLEVEDEVVGLLHDFVAAGGEEVFSSI